MGADIDTGKKGSVNVHLDIVPFIDLMSCLTAFLLVTAVWSNLSRIDIEARGASRSGNQEIEQVQASVHVTDDAIWVGLSRLHEFQRIDKVAGSYDWQALREVLVAHKARPFFDQRQDIEIAADDAIPYQTLIATIDTAVSAGFEDVGVTDPNSLSARRRL